MPCFSAFSATKTWEWLPSLTPAAAPATGVTAGLELNSGQSPIDVSDKKRVPACCTAAGFQLEIKNPRHYGTRLACFCRKRHEMPSTKKLPQEGVLREQPCARDGMITVPETTGPVEAHGTDNANTPENSGKKNEPPCPTVADSVGMTPLSGPIQPWHSACLTEKDFSLRILSRILVPFS